MAKYEINFLATYNDAALLDELRRVADLVPADQPLTSTAYSLQRPRISVSALRHRFGGWRNALDRAGLLHRYSGAQITERMLHQPGKFMSDDRLLDEIRRAHMIVGRRWLTRDDFNAHAETNDATLRKRFGSFKHALELADVPSAPHKARTYTDEACFSNLAKVWEQLGAPPSYSAMFELPSAIQGKTYVLRWGTWRKALLAFAAWANSDAVSVNTETNVEPASVFAKSVDQPTARSEQRDYTANREVRPGLRFKVLARDGFRCVACGRSPATHQGVVLHADHILPVAAGGKTTFENLQALCTDCNLGKGRTLLS